MTEKKLRVFIVDDEVSARYTIKRQLERIEFCTSAGEAENGQRALELIADAQADVVLADISMPGMDGIELAKRISALYPKIKIIMLTMHSSFDYALSAFRLGAIDYVLKDAYDIAPLRAALEKAKNEIDKQSANEVLKLEKELRLQINTKASLGKTGRFVRFHLPSGERLSLTEKYNRLNRNAVPLSEDLWLAMGEIGDGNAFTWLDAVVTASEVAMDRFMQADGEHFYFPAIFRLSGILYDGVFSAADKERIAGWCERFLLGDLETFPGDFAALCIEKRISPEDAKRTLLDCIRFLSSAAIRLSARIREARSIHEIEIILRGMLLTEQLSVVKTNRVIEDVKKYIDEHLNEELSLRTLSDVVELSPGYLSTYFKQETGVGLKQYIQSARLKLAARLLKTTNMKIYQIAERCGFVDVRYFSTQFTQRFGLTPQKYRLKGRLDD